MYFLEILKILLHSIEFDLEGDIVVNVCIEEKIFVIGLCSNKEQMGVVEENYSGKTILIFMN